MLARFGCVSQRLSPGQAWSCGLLLHQKDQITSHSPNVLSLFGLCIHSNPGLLTIPSLGGRRAWKIASETLSETSGRFFSLPS